MKHLKAGSLLLVWLFPFLCFGQAFIDVGPIEIVSPTGWIVKGSSITPSCSLSNCGDTTAPDYYVRLAISSGSQEIYACSVNVSGHEPDEDTLIEFPVWVASDIGAYSVFCRTKLVDDQTPSNDTLTDSFNVSDVWTKMADMPHGVKYKNVKDGGSLAYDPDSGLIYAFKGNNTYEFYSYNLVTGAWLTRDSIPALSNGKKKPVKAGGALCVRQGKVYAVKGNKTSDFWRFDPSSPPDSRWYKLTDVPLGPNSRGVKSGTCLVAGVGDSIFLLKGGSTEFWLYDVAQGTWDSLAPPDSETIESRTRWNAGSCLAFDGDNVIYALKGTGLSSINRFCSYDIGAEEWTTQCSLPMISPPGTKKTRVRYGAGIACAGSQVYALKGGNTNEFWRYDPDSEAWFTAVSVPQTLKRVKSGCALVTANGFLWALRGNNTLEFYRYLPTDQSPPPGQGEQASTPGANEVAIATCANATATTPRWSHDGVWVAFCRTNQDHLALYKVPANGGQEVLLTTNLSGDISNPVWSPNDSSIAFEYESDGYAQVAVVPSSGGQVNVLTSDAADHQNPVFSVGGNGLFYSRFDATTTGYDQIYYISSSGGSEQAISSTSYAHENPQVLSNTEVICERDGDDVYTGIYKLNVNTGQEIELSAGSADYSGCCVAPGARLCAAEKVGQDGFSQIVVFSADGGTETVVTSGNYDFESPTICHDGSVVSCVRVVSSGSALCVIDLLEGTCEKLTDDLADRDLC